MATFSISDAIGSGFGLITRRPLSVLAWGLVYLLVIGLPAWGVMAWIGPGLLQDLQTQAQSQANVSPSPTALAASFQLQMRLMQLQAVILLAALPGQAVLHSAIYRSVLEPKDTAFASLRVGVRELWLLLANLAFYVLIYLILIALMVGFALLAVAAGLTFNAVEALKPWAGWAIGVIVVIGVATFFWIALRLSLYAPMTVAERRFRLFESWKLTKGSAWRLFALALLQVLILLLIGSIVLIALALTVGLARFAGGEQGLQGWIMHPPASPFRAAMAVAWWAPVAAVALGFVEAALITIVLAPWATAYRGLSLGRGEKPNPLVLEPEQATLVMAETPLAANEPPAGASEQESRPTEPGAEQEH